MKANGLYKRNPVMQIRFFGFKPDPELNFWRAGREMHVQLHVFEINQSINRSGSRALDPITTAGSPSFRTTRLPHFWL